jgi:Putative Ig domain
MGHKNGHSFFVTPTGEPFYSTGIDHVAIDPGSNTDETTGQCPWCETVATDWPSTAAWATATVSELRSWGFNSLGAFTDNATFASQMPYSVQLSMASGDDWFAPSFTTNADDVAATQVAPLADDPNLIGWYTDSELTWGPDIDNSNTELQDYLDLPAGSPGLAVAEQYIGNPDGFLTALATHYFQVTTAAIRMYDPNHLILGVKAEGQYIQPELLEAASHYVNVFSIDDYALMPGFAQIIDEIWPEYLPVTPTYSNFEKYLNGTPIMVAEYSFIASTPQTPDTVPGTLAVAPTQQARAAAYTNFIWPLYEDAPWVVGDEWFELVDEPAGGRFDGENNNFGVVNVDDQPYQDLVTQLEIMHSIAPDRTYQTGPTCDSWADSSSGVVCTATMPEVNYPLSVFTTSLTPATQGTKYSNYVIPIGGTPHYTLSLPAGQSLPDGLKLNAKTGLVSGKPKVFGTFMFTVNAVDSTSPTPESASQSVSITVTPKPITIKTTGLRAVQSHPYCHVLSAKGGDAPYTWTVTDGALPSGLTLNNDGSFTGSPSVSGTFTFTVQVSDAYVPADTASQSLTVKVAHGTPSHRTTCS